MDEKGNLFPDEQFKQEDHEYWPVEGGEFSRGLMGGRKDESSVCSNKGQHQKSIRTKFKVFCYTRGIQNDEECSVHAQEYESTEKGK